MPIQIATFKAICMQCQSVFSIPLLPDQAFGEFIAWGENGKAAVYLSAYEDGNWDYIISLYHQVTGGPLSDIEKETNCVQWLIGRCLDTVEGENLSIMGGPVCPACHSHRVGYGNSIKTGGVTLQDATFGQFSSLNKNGQIEHIRELLGSYLQIRR